MMFGAPKTVWFIHTRLTTPMQHQETTSVAAEGLLFCRLAFADFFFFIGSSFKIEGLDVAVTGHKVIGLNQVAFASSRRLP